MRLILTLQIILVANLAQARLQFPGEARTPDRSIPPVKLVYLPLHPAEAPTPDHTIPPVKLVSTPVSPILPTQDPNKIIDPPAVAQNKKIPVLSPVPAPGELPEDEKVAGPRWDNDYRPPWEDEMPKVSNYEEVDPMGVGPAKEKGIDFPDLAEVILNNPRTVIIVEEDGSETDVTEEVLELAGCISKLECAASGASYIRSNDESEDSEETVLSNEQDMIEVLKGVYRAL